MSNFYIILFSFVYHSVPYPLNCLGNLLVYDNELSSFTLGNGRDGTQGNKIYTMCRENKILQKRTKITVNCIKMLQNVRLQNSNATICANFVFVSHGAAEAC